LADGEPSRNRARIRRHRDHGHSGLRRLGKCFGQLEPGNTCTTIIASYERDRFTSRNGTGPSSEIDNARETPHSSHGGDEGLGAMADGPS
jgi:hypothetical protein